MGVVGFWWPSSANFSLLVRPSFTFMKRSPNSSYAADDATSFKIVHRVKIAPLSVMGSPYLGTTPRKKWPDAQLLAFFSDSWDDSEWMFNTMSDAWNLIVASVFVAR